METIKNQAINLDQKLSYKLFKTCPKTQRARSCLKALEWSCHGIPWIAGTITLIYMFPSHPTYPQLLVGLLLDCLYVAIVKALARRRRPVYAQQDDQFCVVLVDKHSFPSGHASRAFYIACFAHNYSILSFLVWIWAASVAVSRVLLGRHHVGDVIAGTALGFVEYLIQYGLGLPITNACIWAASAILGVQFANTNDGDNSLDGDTL